MTWKLISSKCVFASGKVGWKRGTIAISCVLHKTKFPMSASLLRKSLCYDHWSQHIFKEISEMITAGLKQRDSVFGLKKTVNTDF